ncbi:MAG: anaerobic sulfatase maturase [Clostridia bacterium]|nr:anaerobic sulfatase maturase [Clostridia bacterium]
MPPVNLLIKPASSLCNMRCRYCFYCDVAENRNTASYGIMTPETTEAMLKNVFAYATGSVSISFQGGEPTLAGVSYFRHFHEMAEKYNTANIPVSYAMQTNGYNMPEELAKLLAEHRYLLGVSLDGMGKLHDALRPDSSGEGTFRKVNETLHTLEKYGIDYNILCVITEQAARNGAEIYKYFRSRNFRYIQFIPYVSDFGREEESHPFTLTNKQYARFLNTTFRLYYEDFCSGKYISVRQFDNFVRLAAGMAPECCGMSGVCYANLVVEADGSVYPCDFYVLDAWRMGNITADPVPELLKTAAALDFVKVSEPVEESCRSCPCLPVCRGGCRRHREKADGTIGLNRYCEAYQAFFRENMTWIRTMAAQIRR